MTTRMQALSAAAKTFREYAASHLAQAKAVMDAGDVDAGEARLEKARRNQQMAEMCETASGESFQVRVGRWMEQCFTPEIAADKVERGDRLLEEVFELLQAGGYDPERILQVRDYVWNRPDGDINQEVGGVMVTLAAYCNAYEIDLGAEAETELERILRPEILQKIRAKQAAKPSMSPLPQ